MSHTEEVVESMQSGMFSTGIYDSYRNQVSFIADLIGNSETLKYQLMADTMRRAIRAELPLVPISKHGDCDQCLSIGKMAMGEVDILHGSVTKVSVSRTSVEGLYTDHFSAEQLSWLFKQTEFLEKEGVVFTIAK